MKRTIRFAKVIYENVSDTPCNRVTVDIELKDTESGPELSVCGSIWDAKEYDTLSGGQNLDEIARTSVGNDPTFQRIYKLWKAYHLNGMNAGTPEQSAEVDRRLAETGERYDYAKACEWLREVGLYEVPDPRDPSKTYKYGHAWLYRTIPADALAEINALLTA